MNPPQAPQISGLSEQPWPLDSILDELPIGLLIVDQARRILLVNRAFEGLTGFDRHKIQGVPCWHVLRTNLCHNRCPVLKTRARSGPIISEGDIINCERRKIPVRLTTTVINDIAGNVVGYMETVEDIRRLEQSDHRLQQAFGFGQLLGRSPKMEEVFRILPIIAQTDSSVLITGETGTGKDLAAEAIHEASSRSRGPFIKVNCGALPETLLESELFGHQKGAFTGAIGDKPGRVRLAHNGSLFLTEIGDLPLSLQVKLLTFLDDKIVYPLGGAKGFQADVRVIAATHRNLERMIKENRFREDLLFRLNVVRVHLPPLRERGHDTNLLIDHFLKLFAGRFDKKIKGLSDQARQMLLSWDYPGNVRELSNIIEYAANICQSEEIGLEHLPAFLTQSPGLRGEETFEDDPEALTALKAPENTKEMNWPAIERKIIVDALVKAKGKKARAADMLGWGRSTLWRKMKQHGLEG